mgnify:CR=1 FL=1
MLAAIILALHDDATRKVRNAHCGFGLVDVLPTSTRRPVHVDAQIGWIDFDLDRLVEATRLHVVGTGLVIATVVTALLTQRLVLLWLVPLLGYGFAFEQKTKARKAPTFKPTLD